MRHFWEIRKSICQSPVECLLLWYILFLAGEGWGWLHLLVKRKDFFDNQNNDNDHSTIFLSLKSVTINCYTRDMAREYSPNCKIFCKLMDDERTGGKNLLYCSITNAAL